MQQSMRSVVSVALSALLAAISASCSSTSEPLAPISIQGVVLLVPLQTYLGRSAGDSSTIIAQSSSGKRYEQHTNSDGYWSFKDLPASAYSVYAFRPQYGRSLSNAIGSRFNDPRDTIRLYLYQVPTIIPRIDSVVGSSVAGYKIYVSMEQEESVGLGLLIRNAGASDSAFYIWGDERDIPFDTLRGQYVAWAAKDPEFAGKEIAAVAYGAHGLTYRESLYVNRFCSQGPLSNIVVLK
jgi:hypothetical protein